jgi:hypothetical protein
MVGHPTTRVALASARQRTELRVTVAFLTRNAMNVPYEPGRVT